MIRGNAGQSCRILVIGGYGYIGSHLCQKFEQRGLSYEICDIGIRGKPHSARDVKVAKDLVNLTASDLKDFEYIVNLGGTSSVASAINDPLKTLANNVLGHQNLLLLSKSLEIKYLYASSGSVYNGSSGTESMESDPLAPSRNIYDFSKVTADELSRISPGPWTSLRFGTVVGASPNMRHELVLNNMVRDALLFKRIVVSNEGSRRAILFIGDLIQIIIQIIEGKKQSSGIYNLASFNSTMLDLGLLVSKLTGAEIKHGQSTSTYDFSMSTSKLLQLLPGFQFTKPQEVVSGLIDFYTSQNKS